MENLSTRITYIYGLYEIGENEIRYVGKSDNPRKRLRDHKNDKRLTSYKSCWVKSILSKGGDIGLKVIKIVDHKNWKQHEIDMIKEMGCKYNLVNLTIGGDGKMENIYNKNFSECKEWLKLDKPEWVIGLKEYKRWSKMDEFPKFLPKAPNKVFIDWTTWGEYLGTGSVHTHNRKNIYYSYEDAKKYLQESFNLKNSSEFKKTNIPIFIPKKPYNIYKEWCGWENFLGYKSTIRRNREYLDFESAKEWIKNNYGKITVEEYRKKSKDDTLVEFLPKKPEKFYNNFKWSEFLYSNGRKRNVDFYYDFQKSREIVRGLDIKSKNEWRRWYKTKSDDFIRIPSSPEQVYKEWISWYDWLGNKKGRV
jgi:hypothetical protein